MSYNYWFIRTFEGFLTKSYCMIETTKLLQSKRGRVEEEDFFILLPAVKEIRLPPVNYFDRCSIKCVQTMRRLFFYSWHLETIML